MNANELYSIPYSVFYLYYSISATIVGIFRQTALVISTAEQGIAKIKFSRRCIQYNSLQKIHSEQILWYKSHQFS